MSTRLNETKRSQFRQEGYCIVPNFFDKQEVWAMQGELARLEAEGLGRNTMPAGFEKVNLQFRRLDEASALFHALFYHPPVIDAVSALIGEPLRLWLDQIYLKPAHVGQGNVWHTDNTCFQVPDATKGAGMWIALHDASRANGTLELIPRSFCLPEVAERQGIMSDYAFMLSLIDETQAVAAEMEAGGAVFFNFATFHCTRDNVSPTPRGALALHFIQSDNLPPAAALHQGRNIPLDIPTAGAEAGNWQRQVKLLHKSAPQT